MKPTTIPKRTAEQRAEEEAIRRQHAANPVRQRPAGVINQHSFVAILNLVARFKAARESQGLTLAEVAERMGIDPPALSRLETGKMLNPTLGTLHKWAEALGQQLSVDCKPASNPEPPPRRCPMLRHVLLMLASNQPPNPHQEVRTRAQECAAKGHTYLITPRPRFSGLQPDESEVAFFGNQALDYAYLGKGIYLDYIPLTTRKGQDILKADPIYSPLGMPVGAMTPKGAQAFIKLRDVMEAAEGEGLNSLNGIIDAPKAASHGLPLTVSNVLDRAQARTQTYYRKATPDG